MRDLPVIVTIAVTSSFGLFGTKTAEGEGLASLSTGELERRLEKIDAELEGLAETSLNSGVGPIGYRSDNHPDPDHWEWVEVDLGIQAPIDEVVLVPTLWRSTEGGFVADAFPAAFRIVVGTPEDPKGTVVADVLDTDALLPRIEPLIIAVPRVDASWIRLEAYRLAPRAFDGRYLLQIAELLVFSGEENRALRRPVTCSPNPGIARVWGPRCMVDGILPYLMNASQGEGTLAFTSAMGVGDQPWISIDLGEETAVSGIRLHAADQSDTVPQAHLGDFGFPRSFRVEVADQPEFSDARGVMVAKLGSIHEMGPIMEWSFGETRCRQVRLTATEPYSYRTSESDAGSVIGFAEIEVLNRGRNLAEGRIPAASFRHTPDMSARSLKALTDGRNLYGDILPLRQWLGELARRHDLETERPVVASTLATRYASQQARVRELVWLAAALVLGIIMIVLYNRIQSQRQEAHIRERIAANLHDNLGANLHAIGLLGDLAKEAVDSKDELLDTVERIRGLTERTGSAARDCANMLEAEHVCDDLINEMHRDSTSLLADLEHEFSWDGEEVLQRLKRRRRIDLYLFYKECIANVIRHSGATRVETRLSAGRNEIRLTVTDNGQGLNGRYPVALKRRARLLGAELRAEEPPEGGTRIDLRLKNRKLGNLI